jgi:hypothetical protein
MAKVIDVTVGSDMKMRMIIDIVSLLIVYVLFLNKCNMPQNSMTKAIAKKGKAQATIIL